MDRIKGKGKGKRRGERGDARRAREGGRGRGV